jgi:hypothetical protein
MPAPIIFQDQSGLAQGISGATSALAGAFAQQQQEKKQKQYGSILEQTIGSLGETASPLQVTGALSSAIKQGVPLDTAQNFSTLYKTLQGTAKGMPPGPEQINTMSTLFKKFGMDEDVATRNAELWGQLTTGGQTEMAKMLVDQISRQQFSAPQEQTPVDFTQTDSVTERPGQIQVEQKEEFKFPKVDVFEDRTPKERIALKSELLKSNTAKISEASESVRKKESLVSRYSQLERLNDSGKLPEGLQNLNINWTTGDIRYPKLANPETQAYVKAINDFTTQAKDTFGARVTNFELGAFMKRLPTLANSSAGRKIIIDQMKFATEADGLYDKALLDVYDNYGSQQIDFSKADKIARDKIEDQTDVIRQKALENLDDAQLQESRMLAPEGKIPARAPDGSIKYVWRHQADKAAQRGYKIL